MLDLLDQTDSLNAALRRARHAALKLFATGRARFVGPTGWWWWLARAASGTTAPNQAAIGPAKAMAPISSSRSAAAGYLFTAAVVWS